MKTFALKITVAVIAILTLSFANAFAQDSTKINMEHNHKMEMGKDMHHHMHMHEDMEMDSSGTTEQSIEREGEIDLESIDANKDGKVFQDQMDWNVISDKPGECPLCGMKLKEVTLEKAKENLTKNGFKVK